jgi:hypothetical protein
MRHLQNTTRALVAGLAAALMFTAPVLGGSIANLTVTNLSSPDMFINTTLFKQESRSSATLLSSNPTAVMPTFSARLAGLAVADADGLGVTKSTSLDLSMQIDFDILATPTESWRMQIDQLRRFALTLRDDAANANRSQASINFQLGSYSFSPGTSGSIAIPLAGSENTGSVAGNLYVPGAANNSSFLSGVGPTSVQLNFSEEIRAQSFNSNFFSSGQEGSVRFGIAGSLPGVISDDYPGIGGRTVSDDGQFVNVKLTFVPEPTSIALLAAGGFIFTLRGKRGLK